jgi:hypothetical protein
MVFYKTFRNYLKKERTLYDKLILRRKERFLQLIELDAPEVILKNESELVSQSFQYYLSRRIQNKVLRLPNRIRLYLL